MKYLDKIEFDKANSFGLGNPNDAYAQYFDVQSYLNALTEFGKAPLFLANVTFEPGTRNHWHVHHADKGGGQILICTAGEGWYQEDSLEVPGENCSNEWLEAVSDEDYGKLS